MFYFDSLVIHNKGHYQNKFFCVTIIRIKFQHEFRKLISCISIRKFDVNSFFIIISVFKLFIFFIRTKTSEALYFGQPSSDYPELLSEMLKIICYIQLKKIFFKFHIKRFDQNLELLRQDHRAKCGKVFFLRTQEIT